MTDDDEYDHSEIWATNDAKKQRDNRARELRKEKDAEGKLKWWVQIESKPEKNWYAIYYTKREGNE